MRKRNFLIPFLSLLLLYIVYGLYVNRFSPSERPDILNTELNKNGEYWDYRGLIHVSTNNSEGSGSLKEISQAASQSKTDFVIISDKNIFNQQSPDKYYDDVLLIQGGKYSYIDSFILSFGTQPYYDFKSLGQTQLELSDLLSKSDRQPDSMFFVLAHPLRKGYKLEGEYPVGLDGIEVINLKKLWDDTAQNRKLDFIWSLLMTPFNMKLSLANMISSPKKELELWDELLSKRPITAFVGSNSTAKAIIFPTENGYLKFPTYKDSFSHASNHIFLNSELTGNPEKDRLKILRALKASNFYFSLDILHPSKGFISYLKNDNKKYPIGSNIKYEKGLKLYVNFEKAIANEIEIKIIKDGQLHSSSSHKKYEVELSSPGIYRVEVKIKLEMPFPYKAKWFPWIFTNPYYLN